MASPNRQYESMLTVARERLSRHAPESIARRAADQAAADPIQMHLRFLNSFWRGDSIVAHKRFPTFFFCFPYACFQTHPLLTTCCPLTHCFWSNVTHSRCSVCGNMSTGWMRVTR